MKNMLKQLFFGTAFGTGLMSLMMIVGCESYVPADYSREIINVQLDGVYVGEMSCADFLSTLACDSTPMCHNMDPSIYPDPKRRVCVRYPEAKSACHREIYICALECTIFQIEVPGGYRDQDSCGAGYKCDVVSHSCVPSGIAPQAVCGDGQCNGTETCSTCQLDCGACPGPICGDGQCETGETAASCPVDCCPALCGNGVCDVVCNEPYTCFPDCPAVPKCGNGQCETGETAATCQLDCCPALCGNGYCDTVCNEQYSCAADCVTGPKCGNGQCETGETVASCPLDCCPALCGNGICDAACNEQYTCVADCPTGPKCGNGLCETGEITSCPQDCCSQLCGNGKCDHVCNEEITCQTDCKGSVCGDGICDEGEWCESDCYICKPISPPLILKICYAPAKLTELRTLYQGKTLYGAAFWNQCQSSADWSKNLGYNLAIDANGCFTVSAAQVCQGFTVGMTVGTCIFDSTCQCANCTWINDQARPDSWQVNAKTGTSFLGTSQGWQLGDLFSNVDVCKSALGL